MKKRIMALFSIITLMVTAAMPASAQAENDEPIITIKTHRYDMYGEQNIFQMSMLATERVRTTNIQVDFGFGKRSFTITSDGRLTEDEDNEVITGGTLVAGAVSPEGMVRVYGNADDIDYLDCHGSSVYEIDLSKMTQMSILELGHNEINKLDLSAMPYLEYLDVKDNPFNEGFILGNEHRYIKYINVNQMGDHALDHCNGVMDLKPFPALRIFTAWDSKCMKSIDVTNCPLLYQLSMDNSGVTSVDLSNNERLTILNVADCGFNTLDISHNPYLVELYVANEGQESSSRKLSELDLSNNPHLQRVFCSGNNLTYLDVSKQKNLVTLSAARNYLTYVKGVDVNEEECVDSLAELDISVNSFDFATLPEVDPMTYFYYDFQRDIPVAKEQCVGVPLDFSSRVLREGTTTIAVTGTIARDGYSEGSDYLIEGIDYIYDAEKGTMTYLTAHEDSIQVVFFNDVYSGVALGTTSFLVRSAEDFGKPVEKFNVTPEAGVQFTFDVTTREDETISVDFGDGNRQEYSTSAGRPSTISGIPTGAVRVYGSIASAITSLSINQQNIIDIDLNKLTDIEHLTIKDSHLKSIDLVWNHLLKSIDLSGNELTFLDLTGENNAFHKNLLTHIDISNNKLDGFEPGVALLTFRSINASNNMLREINLDQMENIQTLDISNNRIEEIDLSDCFALRDLNVSNNMLTEIDFNACTELTTLNISGNAFIFPTLPEAREGFTLAPQQLIPIAEMANSVDLSKHSNINGIATTYVWKEVENGNVLTEGTDYTISNGKTIFTENVLDKKVYCEMSNALFPEFTGDNVMKTTAIIVTGTPKHLIATFETKKKEENVGISISGTKPGTYVYIDWGDGDLQEYGVQDAYAYDHFSATTQADATVKVYSNTAENGNLYGLNVTGATLKSIDVTKLTDLYHLTVTGARLYDIDVTKNTKLAELDLSDNYLSEIDLSQNHDLTMLCLRNNYFTELNLEHNPNIVWLYAAYNEIENVNTSALTNVYNIELTGNSISHIDMSPMTHVGQVWLAQNLLEELDLSNNQEITVLDIATNYFKFSTLPVPQYNVYYYGNQKPIEIECVDGKIDLSSEYEVLDSETQMYFFEGEINLYYDENDQLQLSNYEYIEGTDFVNNNGIITFSEAHPAVTGLLINENFPDILLYTTTIPVTAGADGIKEIESTSRRAAMTFNLAGQRVSKMTKGLVIENGKVVMNK